jgi:hypothetical protein
MSLRHATENENGVQSLLCQQTKVCTPIYNGVQSLLCQQTKVCTPIYRGEGR